MPRVGPGRVKQRMPFYVTWRRRDSSRFRRQASSMSSYVVRPYSIAPAPPINCVK
jgi:hypothetical protein